MPATLKSLKPVPPESAIRATRASGPALAALAALALCAWAPRPLAATARIQGRLDLAGLSPDYVSLWAEGAVDVYPADLSSGTYAIDVMVPDQGSDTFEVSGYLYTDNWNDYLALPARKVAVAAGGTAILDLGAGPVGTVSGQVSLSGGGTLSSGGVEAGSAGGPAFASASTSLGRDGAFAFPVQAIRNLAVTGSAVAYNGAGTLALRLDTQWVDLGPGGQASVLWNPRVPAVAPGALAGTVALRGSLRPGSILISGNGPPADAAGNAYSPVPGFNQGISGSAFVRGRLAPGYWGLRATALFDGGSTTLRLPDSMGAWVPEGDTARVSLAYDLAYLSGRVTLAGPAQVPPPVSLLLSAWGDGAASGGQAATMADSTGGYRLALTPGRWIVGGMDLHFQDPEPAAGSPYLDCGLTARDPSRAAAPGPGDSLTGFNLGYGIGEVTVDLGRGMSEPRLDGSLAPADPSARGGFASTLYSAGPEDADTVGRLALVGFPGAYRVTLQAWVGDSLVRYGPATVEVEAGRAKTVAFFSPYATIAAPAPDQCVDAGAIGVQGLATAPSGLRGVTVDGLAAALAPAADTGDPHARLFSAVAPLPPGPHTFTIQATDSGGASRTWTRVAWRDSSGPVVTGLRPAAGFATTDSTAEISGILGGDVDPAYLALDGRDLTATGVPVPGGLGFQATVALAVGDNAFRLDYRDRCGRTGSLTLHIVREITDHEPPRITIRGVADGARIPDSAAATYAAADSGSGLGSLSATLDGAPYASGQMVAAPGAHTLEVRAVDGVGNAADTLVRFTVVGSPALSLADAAGAYSDPAAIAAVLTFRGAPLAGMPVRFTAGGMDLGQALTDASGRAGLAVPLYLPAGNYPLTAAFAGDGAASLAPASAAANLLLAADCAKLAFTSAGAQSALGPVALSAKLDQQADGHPGDLSLARVRFDLSLQNADGSLSPAGSYWAQADTGGAATVTAPLTPGVYRVVAQAAGQGYFASAPESTQLAVYDPRNGSASGAGWARVSDPAHGNLGNTLFGFSLGYRNGAPSGMLFLTWLEGKLSFRSTGLSWLAIAGNTAQCQGTGAVAGKSGAYTFSLVAEDNAGTGQPDRLTLRIWSGTDTGAPPVYQMTDQGVALGNLRVKAW